MFQKIVVAHNESPESERALATAIQASKLDDICREKLLLSYTIRPVLPGAARPSILRRLSGLQSVPRKGKRRGSFFPEANGGEMWQ
jgi:hypothetical protein